MKNKTKYLKKIIPLFIVYFVFSKLSHAQKDYTYYHRQVISAEKYIADKKYEKALSTLEALFKDYDFIFLREYKVAAQLSFYLDYDEKGIGYLKRGILSGWKLKSIRKNKFIRKSIDKQAWRKIKKQYPKLREQYESRLNNVLKKDIKKLLNKDQWKAFGALFTFSSDAQDRYAEKRFAPHSKKQLNELASIFKKYGYPGEQLIGNDYWVSTILSHHNSISKKHTEQDTLYEKIKPTILIALKNGEISPFEKALIEEWRHSTLNESNRTKYGFLDMVTSTNLNQINLEREAAFLRSIETRNKLVKIEEETGMNFYLRGSPWVEGEISIQEY